LDVKSEPMKPAFLAGVTGITNYLGVEVRAFAFWILGQDLQIRTGAENDMSSG